MTSKTVVKSKAATSAKAKSAAEAKAGKTNGKTNGHAAGAAKVAKGAAAVSVDADGFVATGKGYWLGLRDGKLACKNATGQILGSVPKELRDSEVAERLTSVRDFLKAHDDECLQTVEGWMLRSLPTPMSVLLAVWPDESFRRALENMVMVRVDGKGVADLESAGFLKGVDEKKGLGFVDADGETVWHKATSFTIPHPILLSASALEDFRALAAELALTQPQKQLFREVFTKPKDLKPEQEELLTYRGGKFEQLMHARGAVKSLGYRMSGSWAMTRVFEGGRSVEARLWIDGDSSDDEAMTSSLVWVDEKEKTLLVKDVPPIAFSEGMRMGAAIFGKRVIEKKEDANA